jgi:hypothetical protein
MPNTKIASGYTQRNTLQGGSLGIGPTGQTDKSNQDTEICSHTVDLNLILPDSGSRHHAR